MWLKDQVEDDELVLLVLAKEDVDGVVNIGRGCF